MEAELANNEFCGSSILITREEELQIVEIEKILSQDLSNESSLLMESSISPDISRHYKSLKNLANCFRLQDRSRLLNELYESSMDEYLFQAVINDNIAFAAVLLRFGADINQTKYDDHRGLFFFCRSAEMVHVIFYFGGNIQKRSTSGHCALHESPNVLTAEALIHHGLPVHSKSNGGGTVIQSSTSLDLVKFFISRGVDVNARNYVGYTALHFFVSNSVWEITFLLLISGCDTEIRGRDGMTALELALAIQKTFPSNPMTENNNNNNNNDNDNVPYAMSRMEQKRLDRTIDILHRWMDYPQKNSSTKQNRTSDISRTIATLCLGLISKQPLQDIQKHTLLPKEIIETIVMEYLGPFTNIYNNSKYVDQ
eukprot:gene8278-17034_t